MAFWIWTALNLLLLAGTAVYIWWFGDRSAAAISWAVAAAQIAVVLFLVNVNMHFIFKVIKSSESRPLRIALARLSRKMMKAHVPLALAGTALIAFHAGIMLIKAVPVLGWAHPKLITGFAAFAMLTLTLIGGYRRRLRASGFRRKFHLAMAMVFAAAFLLHLFLPVG